MIIHWKQQYNRWTAIGVVSLSLVSITPFWMDEVFATPPARSHDNRERAVITKHYQSQITSLIGAIHEEDLGADAELDQAIQSVARAFADLGQWAVREGGRQLEDGPEAANFHPMVIDPITEQYGKVLLASQGVEAAWDRQHPDTNAESRELALRPIVRQRNFAELRLAAIALLGGDATHLKELIKLSGGRLGPYNSVEDVVAARASLIGLLERELPPKPQLSDLQQDEVRRLVVDAMTALAERDQEAFVGLFSAAEAKGAKHLYQRLTQIYRFQASQQDRPALQIVPFGQQPSVLIMNLPAEPRRTGGQRDGLMVLNWPIRVSDNQVRLGAPTIDDLLPEQRTAVRNEVDKWFTAAMKHDVETLAALYADPNLARVALAEQIRTHDLAQIDLDQAEIDVELLPHDDAPDDVEQFIVKVDKATVRYDDGREEKNFSMRLMGRFLEGKPRFELNPGDKR